MSLLARGQSAEEILKTLDEARSQDADWHNGKTFSLVYHAGDDVEALLQAAFLRCFSLNALNPSAFPSLRRFETEICQTVAGLLGDPEAVGSLTSGGTESILMAVKTARDWARANRSKITKPNMILPTTVHPAFQKAMHYFDVEARLAPVDESFRVDVAAVEALCDENTILIVGSAPAYPHGVIDPITELAAIAQKRGILCHVDACLGGMILPFVEKLGEALTPWNFKVPGVTSMSCDLHKYGYAAKGASLVFYKTRSLRKHQFLGYASWPGGLWGSPTAAGTRPGGPIAAAWAVLRYLGEEGYVRLAKQALDTSRALQKGIAEHKGLYVLGKPVATIFAFASNDPELDIYALGKSMDQRGWNLDKQQLPPALHAMITASHAKIVTPFLADLGAAVDEARREGPPQDGMAAMYGMAGALPDKSAFDEIIVEFLDGLDMPQEG